MCRINKNITFIIIIFVLIQFIAFAGKDDFIEPTTDFSLNFVNFPQAWQVSRGANAHIGIVYDPTKTKVDWVAKTQRTAPEAKVSQISKTIFLSSSSEDVPYNIILILESIDAGEYEAALKAIHEYIRNGIAIILPAYFGSMQKDYDYSPWREFVRQASQKGAIIVGAHGREFQLGDLTFWQEMPVDIYALNHYIDSFNYMKFDALIKQSLEDSAYLVAGVAALMVSKKPNMSPVHIKQQLREEGRKIEWVIDKENKWAWPTWNYLAKGGEQSEVEEIKNKDAFKGTCLDAGMALGLEPLVEGQWCRQVLNVKEAQQIATGKGVTVAILDWLFNKDVQSLKERVIKPGSVVDDPIFSSEIPGHGTWMANHLIKVAPDVKIIPVRFVPSERFSDYKTKEYPANLIKGIDYAVKNGADIITISHQPIPDGWQEKLDEAIKRAVDAGTTIVYINYRGGRKDIIISDMIEYTVKANEHTFVVGTGFVNESSFPFCWGVSQTAPIVGGVIAMMKELKPDLKPAEIREILLKSGRSIEGGFQVLDAVKALKNVK